MAGLKRRLGIFGGTFDPPHIGHLVLAEEACYQLKLDRILWVLTPNPPHKKGQIITSLDQRLELLQAAVWSNPGFEISRVDIDRQPPHYAVDTVNIISNQYPNSQLIYLMGGDSLRDLPTWHTPKEFIALCGSIGVMRRPGSHIYLDDLERLLPGIGEMIAWVEAPLLDISSTDIRQRIYQRRPYRYFLPTNVYKIIRRNQLYLL